MEIHTFPDENYLMHQASITPDYMAPDTTPFAVVLEAALLKQECIAICEELMQEESYSVDHCNAVTREKVGSCESLTRVYQLTKIVNDQFWKYSLNDESVSWLQTYGVSNDYQLHMDGAPGQMRKLTAVVLLTDPEQYAGGDLVLEMHPATYTVPKTRGTIVFFQPWIWHRVTPLMVGMRQTVNVGFYGPPFR